MANFLLELVTPERVLFAEQVQQLRAPGISGSYGVLAQHAPFLTELDTGIIMITFADGSREALATSGGFMQVRRDKTIVLADTAERAEEINLERARASLATAQMLLGNPGGQSLDEIRRQMKRALNRIEVAQMRSL